MSDKKPVMGLGEIKSEELIPSHSERLDVSMVREYTALLYEITMQYDALVKENADLRSQLEATKSAEAPAAHKKENRNWFNHVRTRFLNTLSIAIGLAKKARVSQLKTAANIFIMSARTEGISETLKRVKSKFWSL